jgi:hypothetical protein
MSLSLGLKGGFPQQGLPILVAEAFWGPQLELLQVETPAFPSPVQPAAMEL